MGTSPPPGRANSTGQVHDTGARPPCSINPGGPPPRLGSIPAPASLAAV